MPGSANQLTWQCCLLRTSDICVFHQGPNTNVDPLPMFTPPFEGSIPNHPKLDHEFVWETHGDLGTWGSPNFKKPRQARFCLVRANAQQQYWAKEQSVFNE